MALFLGFLETCTETLGSYLQLVQPDVKWTIAYVVFFLWMYLFHAPFRVHSNCVTDWYAQLTKVLQAWFGIVVLVFHVGPLFFFSRRPSGPVLDVNDEATEATVFFPTFCATTLIILYIHKKKRDWGLSLTYGSTVTIVLLNALLLSFFSTVHYAYCMQLQARDRQAWVMGVVDLICPASARQAPFLTLSLLVMLNVLFIVLDYQYKRLRGFDPVRGLLWSEAFDTRQGGNEAFLALKPGVDWRRSQPRPRRVSTWRGTPAVGSTEALRRSFAAPQAEMESLMASVYPVNRPGMVPWFSTFIVGTAVQAVLGAMLNFLTFDQRGLELHAAPKVFHLSFEHQGGAGSSATSDANSARSPFNALAGKAKRAGGHPEQQDVDVWFDFIGDVGDGFNSTYEMARLMAQPALLLPTTASVKNSQGGRGYQRITPAPFLNRARAPSLPPSPLLRHILLPEASTKASVDRLPLMVDDYMPRNSHYLPRASFVLIGGDLAYPNPTDETYRTRLQGPYEDALGGNAELRRLVAQRYREVVLSSVANSDEAHVSMLPATRVDAMVRRGGLVGGGYSDEDVLRSVPLLFAIPGNHDWLDGLVTFKKYIIAENWLGGWLMPQRSSFFILTLPYNWYIFCGDTGNIADIDCDQRDYFLKFIEVNLNDEACAIVTCHEPAWVHEAMDGTRTSPMQPQLNRVLEALGTRLRLRLSGDIHHYSRHTPADALSDAPTLVVSGGGGAFLHGMCNALVVTQGTEYRRSSAFPSRNVLTSILARLVGFRLINWKFDIIAGFLCFGLIMSALPLTMQDERMRGVTGLPQYVVCVASLTLDLTLFTFEKAVVSLLFLTFIFVVFFSGGAGQRSVVFRLFYASYWTLLVVLCSTGVLAVVHTTLIYMTNRRMLLSTRGHWGSMMEVQVRSAADTALVRTRDVLGEDNVVASALRRAQLAVHGSWLVESVCIFLRGLDVVENLAYLSHHVSMNVTGTFSPSTDRLHIFLYYLHLLLIYWLLATPLISFVIGMFLFVSVQLFGFMYDAAYSSFQIEDYKHFIRFNIDNQRRLHGYVVAERRVPKVWKRDVKHVDEFLSPEKRHLPPHLRERPSRWQPVQSDGEESVAEVLEHFVVKPHRLSGHASANNGVE
ncbi:hypothetical protein TraAM80_05921 [Trypanosoma rangeli]|uniref:Uncharacterized protein n=1 Tax=Trypanosoma rangeli TaxID=5698 RepID=A0A422NCF3_TRYRA|nr:uncharacterized protein TraAM80_05921 [Trypanosoma rangeli]RNF03187.1 hypothetical protein TraAM80_05921 [Trypanosoma rangeli]|eukprot:RNF03187.1 hypothetical protein TraAM80_05921 [Trypanosoma rangeli]